ncbi:MAG: hypothetical protein ACLFQ0_19260 [Cyclobacteriaceae bacterium]
MLASLPLWMMLLLFSGCSGTDTTEQQVPGDSIQEEMEEREIKRILPGEIVEAAYTEGEKLSSQAQQIAVEAYRRRVGRDTNFADFVDAQALRDIDSLMQNKQASIHWVAASDDNPQLQDTERQIWEAYLYNVENDLPLNDNVQRLGEDNFLYTRPVRLDVELRKKLPGTETKAEDAFLGMWVVRFSKKALIQSL